MAGITRMECKKSPRKGDFLPSLKIPASLQARRLRVVHDRRLEEVAAVAVGILQTVEVLVRIHDGLGVEGCHAEESEPLVGEPLGIVLDGLGVDSHDVLAEDVARPLDLLLHGRGHHVEDHGLVVDIREFLADLADDIGEERHVRELVAADVGDHAAGRRHFEAVYERVEERESVVEVHAFEQVVRDDRAEEVRVGLLVDEVLVDGSDVLVALQENGVRAPEVVDLVALVRVHHGLEDRGVRLRVDRLLIRLDGQEEIHLRARDEVREVREVHGLDGIEEDEERQDSLVRAFLVFRQVLVEHAGVVLESRDLLGYPEIADHDLVHALGPGVLHGIQVEEAGGRPLDDRPHRYVVVSGGVEEEHGIEQMVVFFRVFLGWHGRMVRVVEYRRREGISQVPLRADPADADTGAKPRVYAQRPRERRAARRAQLDLESLARLEREGLEREEFVDVLGVELARDLRAERRQRPVARHRVADPRVHVVVEGRTDIYTRQEVRGRQRHPAARERDMVDMHGRAVLVRAVRARHRHHQLAPAVLPPGIEQVAGAGEAWQVGEGDGEEV